MSSFLFRFEKLTESRNLVVYFTANPSVAESLKNDAGILTCCSETPHIYKGGR